MKVWARGGLGNQILEYFFGISYAIKKNKTFTLHFSTTPPKKSDFVFHNQSLPMIQNLFYLDRKINLSEKKIKKTIYWDTNLIDCFFSLDKSILNSFIKPKFSNKKILKKYCALHIRGTDKTLQDTEELYDPLIEKAKQSKYPIEIVTDDKKLAIYLSKKHGIHFMDNKNSVYDDWLTLYFADEIFSIYSTFSYSTLLLDPNKRYVIPSFENAYRFYKHADKEYLALSQFLPYCNNLEILGYKKGYRKNFYFDNKICNFVQINDILNKNNSLSSIEKEQILSAINEFNLANIHKSLLKIYKIICKPLVLYNGLFGFNNKIINSIKKYLFFKKLNNLSINEIPNFFLLRDFLIFKTLFGYLHQNNRIEYLKRKYKSTNKSNNLSSKVEHFDKKIQDKGIFIFRDIDKSNLRFFNFLNNPNMHLSNKKYPSYIYLKINLFLNLIYKKNVYSYIAASIGMKYIDLICKLICKKFQLFSLSDCLEKKQNYLYKNNFEGYKVIYIPKQRDFKKSKITYITNSHKPSLDRLIFANKFVLQSKKVESSIYKKNKANIFDNKKIFNSDYMKEINIEENNLVIINDLLLFHADKKFLDNKYFLITL